MRRRWYWIVPAAIIAIPLFLFIGGEVVMRLWNWLLPPLFGWRMLSFWKALGLLALCSILFGDHAVHRGSRPGPRWQGRCNKMTPEKREKFRQAMLEAY